MAGYCVAVFSQATYCLFNHQIIAECLSMRLIIVQVRRMLVGPQSEVVLVCTYVCMYVCMYVCIYVHYGFTIEIYGFMHSLHTSLARAAHEAGSRLRIREQKTMPERVQRYGRRLTAQQKDERRQDNGETKRLARQYLSDLLCSLTCEWGRRRHSMVSSRQRFELHHFVRSNFQHAQHEAHVAHKCIPQQLYYRPL